MDSLINHYTANKKVRNDDAYSPGGRIGLRPDRATLPYCHRAREAGWSSGEVCTEIVATRRVQAAKRLIEQTTGPLSEIAFTAGFRSIRRFNDAFRATYGRPPSSFRRPTR